MVLQSEVRGVIAKGEQKIIVIEVTSAVERAGLGDQVLEMLNGLARGVESSGAVGSGIECVLQVAVEIELLKILAGENGRINQSGERDGRELEHVAATTAFQRGAVLPSCGD